KSSPTSSKAPFVLSPPVSRIDPSKGQSLRLMFTGAPLASDKELKSLRASGLFGGITITARLWFHRWVSAIGWCGMY
ncbi:fimbria/pilus periplasmic chaperone, partial [Klebsiella variicola]|uniref:fimbria/pilus periplasmic chaperone n=1 Tax=Klebsiella variicola TaxID=244366 RepID=UPI002730816A